MTYTASPTKATGDLLAASDWNTYVRDNLADHEARIGANSYSGCALTRASDQNIADATVTYITWTAETIDQGGWFVPSSATITVPAGALPSGYTTILVQVTVQVYWAAHATGTRRLFIEKNGSEYNSIYPASPGAVLLPVALTSSDMPVVPGDTIKVAVAQSSGGTLAVAGASQAAFVTVRRVGYF